MSSTQKMQEITDMYPLNLARAIFDCEDAARNAYIPGISAAVATLSEREQGVLACRFQRKMTLEQTAKEYGVTRERIRQIEAKALRKLRHPIKANMMKAVPLTELQAREYRRDGLLHADEPFVRRDSQRARCDGNLRRVHVARHASEMQLLPEKQEYAGFVGGGPK